MDALDGFGAEGRAFGRRVAGWFVVGRLIGQTG